jgi:two-component system, cell cycle response regulator DivK
MTGHKILLIEDDENLRGAMRLLLERQRCNVLEAATGTRGLALAETHHPSLIMLDLGLPDGDGLRFAEELRRRPSTTRIPILALSSGVIAGQRAGTLGKVCAGTIPRPVTREQLERHLNFVLMLSRRDLSRRFPRYPVKTRAWYRVRAGAGPVGRGFVPGMVRSLSEGGLRMDVASPIAKASLVDVRLPVWTSEVTTVGRVVYSVYRDGEETPSFQHGIQFMEKDPDTLAALKGLMKAPAPLMG